MQHKYQEALEMHEAVLAVRVAELGSEHALVAATQHHIAKVFALQNMVMALYSCGLSIGLCVAKYSDGPI